jgi:hypothetical protein
MISSGIHNNDGKDVFAFIDDTGECSFQFLFAARESSEFVAQGRVWIHSLHLTEI